MRCAMRRPCADSSLWSTLRASRADARPSMRVRTSSRTGPGIGWAIDWTRGPRKKCGLLSKPQQGSSRRVSHRVLRTPSDTVRRAPLHRPWLHRNAWQSAPLDKGRHSDAPNTSQQGSDSRRHAARRPTLPSNARAHRRRVSVANEGTLAEQREARASGGAPVRRPATQAGLMRTIGRWGLRRATSLKPELSYMDLAPNHM